MSMKHQEEPFHSGEVFHLWNFLYLTKNNIVFHQVLINHRGDPDLKKWLEDRLENVLIEEEKQVEGILKETGIRLPPAPPDRPNVELQDIPAGARMNDTEIASISQKECLSEKILCSYIMSICHQENITEMFEEFHVLNSEFEKRLLKLVKDKGWLVLPPINIQ